MYKTIYRLWIAFTDLSKYDEPIQISLSWMWLCRGFDCREIAVCYKTVIQKHKIESDSVAKRKFHSRMSQVSQNHKIWAAAAVKKKFYCRLSTSNRVSCILILFTALGRDRMLVQSQVQCLSVFKTTVFEVHYFLSLINSF